MPKPKKSDVYVATSSFQIAGTKKNPRGEFVPAGKHVYGDDPLIKSHGQFFRLATELVETTTAAPGETRNVTVPGGDSDADE